MLGTCLGSMGGGCDGGLPRPDIHCSGADAHIMVFDCCTYHSSALISLVIQTPMTRSRHGPYTKLFRVYPLKEKDKDVVNIIFDNLYDKEKIV